MKFELIDINNYLNKKEENRKSICYGIFKDFNIDDDLIIKNKKYVKNIFLKELKYDFCKSIILYDIPETNINHLILIQCGEKDNFTDYEYISIVKKCIDIIKNLNSEEFICFLTLLSVVNRDNEWKIKIIIQIMRDKIYKFLEFKTKYTYKINKIILVVKNNNIELNNILKYSEIVSDSVDIAKDLGNLPSNICNSKYINNLCINLCKNNKNLEYEYLDENSMKKNKMYAYLGVSMGSKNKPIMSILKYFGNKKDKKNIVIIGKGLTFDTGGISLKQSKNMDEMKFDMCGAASVYGIMYSLSKLNLNINVIGIMSICENSIDSKSYKPGDIIKTMSGKTVEILNTDAEGRLVLCDSITYSYKFNPNIIIDIATLTGACVIALGKYFSGLISNNDKLSEDLIKASNESNDLIWRLPIIKNNQNQINSDIADIKNIGDGTAGTITAGYFLYNFIKKESYWAHIDIAGTAYNKNKKSTGRPIYAIMQFLINKSKL